MAIERTYTKEELNSIHRTKKAVDKQVYTSTNNAKYLGTDEGTLIFLQNASVTSITNINGIDSTNVNDALIELLSKVSEIEIDYVLHYELVESEKRSRCFATSMAIIL